MVTVGLDVAGAEACRPFVEAARPRHPSLVDVAHLTAQRFGVVNIPSGVWIDEDGTIVRPAEPAFPGPRTPLGSGGAGRAAAAPPLLREILAEAARFRTDEAGYVEALRDWARHGAASRFALAPPEVLARSRRDDGAARAAAHLELARHLHAAGEPDAAVHHFRAAHRLDPANLAAKRQAWSLVNLGSGPYERFLQGPMEGRPWPYEGDWVTEVRAMGPAGYYPPLRRVTPCRVTPR